MSLTTRGFTTVIWAEDLGNGGGNLRINESSVNDSPDYILVTRVYVRASAAFSFNLRKGSAAGTIIFSAMEKSAVDLTEVFTGVGEDLYLEMGDAGTSVLLYGEVSYERVTP